MGDYKIQAGGTEIEVSYNEPSVSVYNCLVDVVRMTRENGALGTTDTPATIVSFMPCSIKWLGGRESILFNKKSHTLDGVVRCRVPPGVTIQVKDKIVYLTKTYEVVDVVDVNNLGVLLEIGIKKIE